MKFSKFHPLSAIGGVTVSVNLVKHRKHGKVVKTVTIFSYVNYSPWLAKFCPFFSLFVSFKTCREIVCFRHFFNFNKTDKMTNNGSLLAVFLAVLPVSKTVISVSFRGD